MFELAAFRKVHPDRPITLTPLFLMNSVVFAWIWLCLVCFGLQSFITAVNSGSGYNSDFGSYAWIGLHGTFYFLPIVFVAHVLRKSYREKHQLLLDLRYFSLDKVSCETDFDRRFILNAIDQRLGCKLPTPYGI